MAVDRDLRPRSEACGVLSVNKPPGRTSHDIVALVRRLTQQRRVGHTGTLDPLATGVLVLCLGQATRLAEYIAGARKTYLARIHFGVLTDTWDADGNVLETRDAESLTLAAIANTLESFQGTIEQVPPMYSALKRDGKPLYRLARQGVVVERAPRPVTIYALEIVGWTPPQLDLRVTCSAGTYIRSLAYDLGESLGPGAHMASLVREQVGRFTLADAVTVDTLRDATDAGAWQQYLMPVQQALDMPGVAASSEVVGRLANGLPVALPLPDDASMGFAYDEQGRFVIVRQSAQNGQWQPVKVLSGCDEQSLARTRTA